MEFVRAFTDFFRTPKWAMNLLLTSVCVLIPVLGPILLLGYYLRCFLAWREGRTHPDFDFNLFVPYLKTGLWPFLTGLVGSLAMFPLLLPSTLLLFLIPALQLGDTGIGVVVTLAALLAAFFWVVLWVVLIPVMLQAGLRQDFQAGFSRAFVIDYLRRTGVDTFFALVVLMVASIVLSLAGYLCLFVGVYPATALIFFAAWHLYQQLYVRYLERGGTEVPVSPELRDPPAAPPAAPPAPQPPPVPPAA